MRVVVMVMLILIGVGLPTTLAQCGGELEPTCEPTPTPTETPTITPTPSDTPTPTPAIVMYSTIIAPGTETGQAYALVFQVDAGQVLTVILLFWIAGLMTIDFIARHREEDK